jgi:hypothetical protein
VIVPLLPPLGDDLLGAHRAAHLRLSEVVGGAAPEVRRLFVFFQRRVFAESLAYVQPVLGRVDDQMLFPAPRAFLTRTQELRTTAAAASFRYLDSRIAMVRLGLLDRMLDPTVPVVVHALMEGVAPSGVETNAGMVRVTPTSWKPEANAFAHPPAREAAEMLDAAVDMAMHAPAPAIARAGWLTFTMLSIHPFVDGNGRTSRTVFHVVQMEDPEVAFEWGIAEQWAVERRRYIEALQAGQQMEIYDPRRLDPLPFMELCAEMSAVGARLCAARLDRLDDRLRTVSETYRVSPEAAMVAVATALWRVITLHELRELFVTCRTQTHRSWCRWWRSWSRQVPLPGGPGRRAAGPGRYPTRVGSSPRRSC